MWKEDDLFADANNFSISNIVRINSQNVSGYLENFALNVNSDPDSSYNTILWNYGAAPGSGYVKLSVLNVHGLTNYSERSTEHLQFLIHTSTPMIIPISRLPTALHSCPELCLHHSRDLVHGHCRWQDLHRFLLHCASSGKHNLLRF
jgi:hypothetical protein